ncbi:MAG: NAD(P)-dependent oxidoreductase [Elusimicrobiales bacterium]|nr:NAD(P)-dependent oxidoreductase [Elusimicrobiales bacterium]
MKILVTGGKGFIARNLAEGLAGEHVVSAPPREELDLLRADAVAQYLKAGHYDVVLHCATYDAAPKTSTKNPAKVLENNLRMFFNIARCQESFGKLVFFGSGAEFGRENWKPRMAEDYYDAHVPLDQYGFSKYLMTRHALRSANVYNLRLFGMFGKYDDWRYRFISNICARAALGLPLVVGQNRRMDFLYIHDLVRVVKWLIEGEPAKQVYNVCSGKSLDCLELARDVLKLSGKDLPITVSREGMGKEYSGDNSLLSAESKLKLTPMPQALQELYTWYLSGGEKIDQKQILSYPL